MRSIVISTSVIYVFVCLSTVISQKPRGRTSPNFSCLVTRSFSDGDTTHHWAHYVKTWRHPQNRKYIRSGPRHGHRQCAQKFGEVRPCGFRDMREDIYLLFSLLKSHNRQTDRQTDRQTKRHTHHNTTHTFWWRCNWLTKLFHCLSIGIGLEWVNWAGQHDIVDYPK